MRYWLAFPHRQLATGWACHEQDFRGSVKKTNTARAAAARARGPCNMTRQLEAT